MALSKIQSGGLADDASNLVLISTQNVTSGVSSVEFTGFDNSYHMHIIYFSNLHPATDDTDLGINFSSDGGTNYNMTKTSSGFRSKRSSSALGYDPVIDADSITTTDHILGNDFGADADQASGGQIFLHNLGSTTYIKSYYTRITQDQQSNDARDMFTGGFIDSTSAVDGIRFAMSSGNIDDGTFSLYGVKS